MLLRDASRLAVAILLGVPSVVVPSRAAASDWLAYRAPASCPTEAQFVAAVGARGKLTAPATPAQRVDVSIRQDSGGFSGSFQVREQEAVSNRREVQAVRCDEVVDGLAVVAAIFLASNPSEAPPLRSSPSPPPPPPPSANPVPASATETYLRKSGDAFSRDVAVSAGTLRFRSPVTYTLSAGVAVGVIPSMPLARLDLNLFRANFATTPNALTYLVGPVVRARVSALGGTHESGGLTTTTSGFSFGMSACRAPVYDLGAFVVLGCIEYSGGFMQLDTKNAAGAQTQTKTSGTAMVGIGGEAEYNFGRYFHVDLKIGGDYSFTTLTAERPDGSPIFQSQPFSAYALLGAGVHF